jgi:TatD DNase family protein
MIDTHCHLTFPDFVGRVDEELTLAAQHGVTGCITISTSSGDCRAALRVAERHGRVWCTSGVHPLYTGLGPHDWDEIADCARSPRCVAWGELGLDNHYADPPAAVQRRVLEEQLALIEGCRDGLGRPGLGKPVVIHCREAFDDLLPLLGSAGLPREGYVFHCFTGTAEEARRVLDFGASLSFTGVVTYANAREVQAAARLVPHGKLMCETDAPYLSPVPRRGERPCRPWMASLTARSVADLRGEPFERFLEGINAATRSFFGIEAELGAGR